MTKGEKNHEIWLHRGREARGRKLPRVIRDGRLSFANRQSFYAGWDKEDLIRAPKPTPEQANEFNTFFRALAAEVRTSINTPL